MTAPGQPQSFSGDPPASATDESPENAWGSEQARLIAELPHGPHDPVVSTPPRRPGSVRRTTTIDQLRGAPDGVQEIVASGRDLLTRADGTTEVVDAVTLRAAVDAGGTLMAIAADPPVPALDELVGGHASKRLRARIDELLPDHRARGTVLLQLLDDFPMAALISSYGSSREQPAFRLPPEAGARLTDLCAGWAGGATMLDALDRTGIFPIPVGPPAPPPHDDGDALARHDVPAMTPRSVRRQRRLDLMGGEPLSLDVHFRDSHLGVDGPEEILHEYALSADVSRGTLTVLAASATARVLPWPECPGALDSAGRVVGQPVSALRQLVASDFTGTSTCTHLNDVLRSLAGVTALAAALER
ncbi:MAG: DUF2889 domain-containing protein [Microthrixaceae bacterium]